MRVLLTGAGGFIGSHVARTLAAQDDEIVAVLRPNGSTERLADVDSELSIVRADLGSADLESLLTDAAPDVCIHLAWYVEPGRYLTAVQENLASLVAGTRLLSALDKTGCPRAVIAGTCLEPGSLIDGDVRPAGTVYAAAKSALHQVARHLERTSVACAHIFYLYGPGEDPQRLVPAVIRACLEGQTIAVSSGEQKRDFLHVEDVASAIVAVAKSDLQERVDICTGVTRPLREVFEAIGSATHRQDLIGIGHRPSVAGEPQDIAGDSTILAGTGWQPRWPLEAGITDTVEWWRAKLADERRGGTKSFVGASPQEEPG